MSVSHHIQAFFNEYETGANTFDTDLNVRERHDVWLSASPGGVALAHNDATFPTNLAKRHQQLLELGYQSAKITHLEELPLDEHYSLVKTAWRQTYQKAGAPIEVDITVDYLVRIEADHTVKIICTIAHEDESALLKRHGVTT